jgi:type II secretory pathway pseudopilin PulG
MRRHPSAMTFVEILVVIAIIALALALLLPMVRSAREPARRNSCMNNLKQIALAINAYEEEHGTLPPAYTVDEQGNRLHSWRTLILPYLEQAALFKTIDLTQPWDHPVNAKAHQTLVEVYQCPSASESSGLTNYLAVVGSDSAFNGSEPRKLSDIKDGPENTIMLIEVDAIHTVHWMSPEDIGLDEVLGLIPDTTMNHLGIILATYFDYHTHAIRQEIDVEVLRGLLTIAGGESIEF